MALLGARLDHLHVGGPELIAAFVKQRCRHGIDGVAVQHGARAAQLVCLRVSQMVTEDERDSATLDVFEAY